jgi:hypothetical protein
MRTALLIAIMLLVVADVHARPNSDLLLDEPRTTRAIVREQLCLSDFRAVERDGGTSPHALRCYLRFRLR